MESDQVTIGGTTSDPSGSYNYLYVRKPSASLAPVVICDGGSYYYGRFEFHDETGNTMGVLKSDGAAGMHVDVRNSTTGFMVTRSGGVPVFIFSPDGNIKNATGTSLLNTNTLGSGVVNSSLTSVGTLNTLTVSGNVTVSGGLFAINTSTARVGIRNSSPAYPLDVGGSINTTGTYLISGATALNSTTLGANIVNSSLTSVGNLASLNVVGNVKVDTDTFVVDAPNNFVGIRKATPAYPLDVNGDCNLSSGNAYRINGVDILTLVPPPSMAPLTLDSGNSRVGLNNASPAEALDVVGNINATGVYKIAGNDVLTATSLGANVVNSSLTSVGTLGSLSVSGNCNLGVGSQYQINGVDILTLVPPPSVAPLTLDSGNSRVGINQATPDRALDVNGNTRLNGEVLVKQELLVNGNVNADGSYKIGGNDVLTSTSLGSNVVSSSLTSVGTLGSLNVTNSVTAATLGGSLTTASQGNITSVGTLTGLTVGGNITQTSGSSSLTNLSVATSLIKTDTTNIRVGINTATPTYTLDVNGTINATTYANLPASATTLSVTSNVLPATTYIPSFGPSTWHKFLQVTIPSAGTYELHACIKYKFSSTIANSSAYLTISTSATADAQDLDSYRVDSTNVDMRWASNVNVQFTVPFPGTPIITATTGGSTYYLALKFTSNCTMPANTANITGSYMYLVKIS